MLSVPMVADGNNFGVEIQEYMVKTLREKKDALKALFDGLNKYSTERGDLWGKAIFPVTEKRSSSKGVKKSSGGEKDSNETTESEDVSAHDVPRVAVSRHHSVVTTGCRDRLAMWYLWVRVLSASRCRLRRATTR